MIYDTTDMEKLDSNIEDTIIPTELNLKGIIIVRVINGFNLESFFFLWVRPPVSRAYSLWGGVVPSPSIG